MRTKLWVILSDGCWWRDEELNYSTLTLICVICFKGWFWFSRLIQGVQRWNLTGHGWVKQHFLDLSDFFFLCFFAWNTEYFHVSRLLNSSVDINFAFFISTETVWGSSAGGCNPEWSFDSHGCVWGNSDSSPEISVTVKIKTVCIQTEVLYMTPDLLLTQ